MLPCFCMMLQFLLATSCLLLPLSLPVTLLIAATCGRLRAMGKDWVAWISDYERFELW